MLICCNYYECVLSVAWKWKNDVAIFLWTFSDLDTMSKLTLYCMVIPIGITPKNFFKNIIAVELTIKLF